MKMGSAIYDLPGSGASQTGKINNVSTNSTPG